MAKGKSSKNLHQILTVVIYVFLIGALGTYFLPIISVQLPALGKKSWSVNDIVSAIPKSLPKAVGQQKAEKSKISVDYDFGDLLQEISPKGKPKGEQATAGAKVSSQIVLGALVPLALALAYGLVLLSFLLNVLKKDSAFFTSSFAAAISAVYALLGTYLLAQAAQKAFSDSMAQVESSPFGAIAKNFVQQVKIQSETGLYALVALTLLVVLVGFYRKNQVA